MATKTVVPNFRAGFGTPEWQAAVDAEIANRPKQGYRPGPLSPVEIELHRQKGEAERKLARLWNPIKKAVVQKQITRLTGLIREAELARVRTTGVQAPHMQNAEYR